MGSKLAKLVSCIILVCVSVLSEMNFALAQTEPEARKRASQFKPQVVRVITHHIDGTEADVGFGLIVSEEKGRIYIATPRHVALGWGGSPPLSDNLEIVFQSNPYDKIPAKRLPPDVTSPEERDDLAVLEVASPEGMTLPRAPIVNATRLQEGTWVWNIGINESWEMPDRAGGLGPENVLTGRRRIGELRTPGGASGGAAVTEDGIIGIVLQDGGDYSLILPIERIISLFQFWHFQVNLLTPLGELDDGTWQTAQKADTVDAYKGYLGVYPKGAHFAQAQSRIATLGQIANDEAAWNKARLVDTVDAYKEYQGAFPKGAYFEQAQSRIDTLEQIANDEAAWNKARLADTVDAYKEYQGAFPKGAHFEQAKSRIATLEQIDNDEAAWNKARLADTVDAYKDYQGMFPKGAHFAQAQSRIDTLEQIANDEAAWNKARLADTVDAYKGYLGVYPKGTHFVQAQSRIEALQQIANDEAAWNKARLADTVDAYKDYQGVFQKGAHFAQAQSRIETLVHIANDEAAWNKARQTDTVGAYKDYQKLFPSGVHISQAQTRIEALDLIVKDEAAWGRARQTDTVGAYKEYQQKFQNGAHLLLAQSRIGQIINDEAGWNKERLADTIEAYKEYQKEFPKGAYFSQAQRRIEALELQSCDKLAANPRDTQKPADVPGVEVRVLTTQAKEAEEACNIAMQIAPNEPRYRYQYARAIQTSNSLADLNSAYPILTSLLKSNYLAAYDNFGWLIIKVEKNVPKAVTYFQYGMLHDDPSAILSVIEIVNKGYVNYDSSLKCVLIKDISEHGHHVEGDARAQCPHPQTQTISTKQRPWRLAKFLCYYSGNCSAKCYHSANCSDDK